MYDDNDDSRDNEGKSDIDKNKQHNFMRVIALHEDDCSVDVDFVAHFGGLGTISQRFPCFDA